MGNWDHPNHYTEAARAFAVASRKAVISVFLEEALPELRAAARCEGYALAVHGSLARDLDLVAIPWVEDASEPDKLVKALCDAVKRITGWGHLAGGPPSAKPHGRTAYTIIASMSINIDLSIVPRTPAAPQAEPMA